MSNSALTCSVDSQTASASVHDQIQIALAIADEQILKSLLVNCTPPIARSHQIGSVTSSIGVPTQAKKVADGLVQFESIGCVLLGSHREVGRTWADQGDRHDRQRQSANLTRCESETHILGQCMSLSQAISLLSNSGFSSPQIDEILNLPYEAWHKSWWYSLDTNGNYTIPFLRLIRTLRYTDGTFTVQYKDYFEQDKPSCFKSQEHKVLIEIKSKSRNFSKVLKKINQSRETLGASKAILICDTISDLEARGFISQGISIYAATEVSLQSEVDCAICINPHCPMRGQTNSPVLTCRDFCPEAPAAV